MKTQTVPQKASEVSRSFASSIAGLPFRFRVAAASGLSMRVHVSTTGPEPGNWLVAIDDGACEVLPGSVSDPDARLYAASDTGHSILNGALPVADALAGRLLFYEGDPVLLQRFRACFHLGEAS